MPQATVYLKNSNSRAGYEICLFLDNNIDALRKSGMRLCVKIVGSKTSNGCAAPRGIKSLPALVRADAAPLIGQNKIIQYLSAHSGKRGKHRATAAAAADPDDEMADHWKTVLGEGDEQGDQGEAMERAKRAAIEETYRHKETRKPSRSATPSAAPPRHSPAPSNDTDDPEDYEDEPAMRKYWANQRES